MVNNCCLVNCKSVWMPNNGITFHRFPKDKNVYEKWLLAIPSNLLKNKNITTYTTICSKHFALNSFVSSSTSSNFRNVLKKDAIPTIFENDYGHIFEIPIISISHDEDLKISHVIMKQENEKENLPKILKTDVGIQTEVSSYVTLWKSNNKIKYRQQKNKKNLLRRLRRHEQKIKEMRKNAKEMTILLKAAEEKNNSIKILEDAVNKYICEKNKELFLNEVWNISSAKKTYTENIKQFAITMYYYSPKVYDFLREKFTLPHDATLRKWTAESQQEVTHRIGVESTCNVDETSESQQERALRIGIESTCTDEISESQQEGALRIGIESTCNTNETSESQQGVLRIDIESTCNIDETNFDVN